MHTYQPDPNEKVIENHMEKFLNNPPKNVTLVDSEIMEIKLNRLDNWFDKLIFDILKFVSFLRDPLHNNVNLNIFRELTPEEFAVGPFKSVNYYERCAYNYRINFRNTKTFTILYMYRIHKPNFFLSMFTYYVKRKLK